MESESNTFRKKYFNYSERNTGKNTSQAKIGASLLSKKLLLEIPQNNPEAVQGDRPRRRIVVSVKPRKPGLETLYFSKKLHRNTEKFQNPPEKESGRTNVHPVFRLQTNNIPVKSKASTYYKYRADKFLPQSSKSQDILRVKGCQYISKASDYTEEVKEKCNPLRQSPIKVHSPITDTNFSRKVGSLFKHVEIGDLFYTNTLIEKSESSQTRLSKIFKKIKHLERKILKQEMVFSSMHSNEAGSSSDEEVSQSDKNISTSFEKPGCSCIEYSQVPESSAFQKFAPQSPSTSSNKAVILDKKHNSEQYSRDFTTYDGITARGRRQCASMTYKRDSRPKDAADRVQKIRHKLPPVRDYRLMDTVHYLAQGEFAPRDDGIKLTSSREAVLSDIIWEDVCRTHWPNARIGRRGPDRSSTRYELQRLIDSLLRERVAHIERRRRRHYRIIKLNNRHENVRQPTGKTGDIIVASHKGREMKVNRDIPFSRQNSDRHEEIGRRAYRSCERFSPGRRHHAREEDCSPGPSCAAPHFEQPTSCFQSSRQPAHDHPAPLHGVHGHRTLDSSTPCVSSRNNPKNPKLIIKKESRRKYRSKEEPGLEHFILLPALVIQTSSSVKKQKKFSTLYQRVSNKTHPRGVSKETQSKLESDGGEQEARSCAGSRSIGFSINITCSSTSQILDEIM